MSSHSLNGIERNTQSDPAVTISIGCFNLFEAIPITSIGSNTPKEKTFLLSIQKRTQINT